MFEQHALAAMVSGTDQLALHWVNNIKKSKPNKILIWYFFYKRGGQFEHVSLTLTTMVDNWDGLTLFPCKTVTTMVDNCGGVTLFTCKS